MAHFLDKSVFTEHYTADCSLKTDRLSEVMIFIILQLQVFSCKQYMELYPSKKVLKNAKSRLVDNLCINRGE